MKEHFSNWIFLETASASGFLFLYIILPYHIYYEAKFETPIIIERSEPNKVELTLPINTITSNGDSNNLKIVKEKISQGLKVSYKDSSKVIIELCKDWISAQEIALRLGYSASHVKNKLIPRMISDGLIEQYDQKSTTSPEQKYRAKQ